MKTTNIKTLATALAAIISVGVLTSCSANTAQTNPEPTETTIAATSQTTPETTEKTQTTSTKETTPSSTKAETQTEKTTAPTTTAPASTAAVSTTKPAAASTTKPVPVSTAPVSTTAPAPEWTESAVSGTMYVQVAGIYSRSKAVLGAPTVKQYNLNDAVSVTAVTNTGYYKLSDGSFIHADYLGADKVTVSTTKPSTSSAAPTVSKPASTQSGTKEEQARAIAKKIAAEVRKEAGEQQSLEQIWVATKKVYNYTNDCVYDINNPDALTAYGAFIANTATCQGVTDALGMVLDELGYTWEHLCKNQYTHQCALVYFNYDYDEDLKKHPEYKYLDDFFIADENNWRTGAAVYADAYVGVMTL